MSEYVTAERMAEILPYTTRQIIAFANKGLIPGAFRIDEKSRWCFDERRARQWFKQRELESCRGASRTSIKGIKRGGSKLSAKATKSTNQLENLLWPLRGNTGNAH